MTLAVDDDFGGFVAARWPDLEAVALVAAPDAGSARELTTAAFAGLAGAWDEVVDEGSPTRAARAGLLRGIAGLAPGAGPPVESGGSTEVIAAGATDGADPGVAAALVRAVRAEDPLVRAALAAEAFWGCDAEEVADLARVAPGRLATSLAEARDRLVAAHRGALAGEGLDPADWRFDRDLVDALDALVAGSSDPPDPAALVAGRARRVRRRSLLAGGAATLAAGGLGWWVFRGVGGRSPDAAPTAPEAASVGDTDPVWTSTARWPPRGSLAADAGVRALVSREGGPGARLLYAGDVGAARVVVAALGRPDGGEAPTVLAAWSGGADTPAARLARVALPLDRVDGADDVVPVAVPAPSTPRSVVGVDLREDPAAGAVLAGSADGGPTLLLLLAPPTVRSATWSPVVHPTANGSVERTWTLVRMDAGVGHLGLDHRPGAAARVRCGGYDGPVAGAAALSTTGLDPVSAASALVATATGVPASDLSGELAVDAPVDSGVLVARRGQRVQGGDGRVRVVRTTTPDGGLVVTLHVDDGWSGRTLLLPPVAVLPAREADAPLVRRLDRLPPRTMRYLVVAPGAATCQLLATTPAGYPVSKVTPMSGDVAVVPIVNGQDTDMYRLVLWDAEGRRMYSDVPPRGRSLLDLSAGY